MTATEHAVLDALLELEQAAASRRPTPPGTPTAPPTDIRGILGRLDRLTAELPVDAPTDLRHYLQRKSYEKARLFLEGRAGETPRGTCGR